MEKPKILVIDDEAAILNALEFFLEQEGYEAGVATSYEKYQQTSQDKMPDLIILDILLGNEDGRDIAARLKKDPSTKNIPIIMISAHPDVADMTKQAGADTYLAKPFETEILLETINNLLEATTARS